MSTRNTIQVAGVDLHLERGGAGPGLLCLHGIGSAAASFDAQVSGLGDLRDVVAWDAPGYGGSAALASPPGMQGYADFVAQLIRSLWTDPVAVMGASWGGTIAMVLAARHPELVDRLILIDSTRGSAATPEQSAAMQQRAVELAEVGPEVFAQRRTPRLVSPTCNRAIVAEAQQTMAQSIRLPGYAHAADSMAQTWLGPELGAVQARTLVICGADDVVTGPTESLALAQAIRGARLEVLPGVGHLANLEAPEAVNDLVRAFLTDDQMGR